MDILFNRTIAENLPNLGKESPGEGSLQNTQPTGLKKKYPQTHHNQNTQHTEQRKNSENCKREKDKSH
jgi:hypothetical protein